MMIKKLFNILMSAAIVSCVLTSCDDPIYPGQETDGEGVLSTESMDVSVLNSEEVIENRSSSYDVSNFTVNVVNKETGNVRNTWKYSEMPGVVTLPVGDYTVEVFNSAVQVAAWDAPYYYASKDVTITKNEIANAGTFVCKLNNVKVSIRYTDELKSLIGDGNDVSVNVVVGESGMLDFAYSETRSGYFEYVEESTTLVATFTGTVEGYYIEDYKVLADVAPGQHRIITFGIKGTPTPPEEYGAIGATGLGLDSSVSVVDMTIDVPVEEEPVDPDDMIQLNPSGLAFSAEAASKTVNVTATGDWVATSNVSWCTVSAASGVSGTTQVSVTVEENTAEESRMGEITFVMGNVTQSLSVKQAAKASETAPTITSTSLDLEGVNLITDGMTATVDISAPLGIQNLYVKIDSETLTAQDLKDVGLDSEFDLANPGSLKDGLSGLGFPTESEVVGKTDLVFDISQFMGLLKAFKSEHRFIITVVDVEGQAAEATLTFLAQ